MYRFKKTRTARQQELLDLCMKYGFGWVIFRVIRGLIILDDYEVEVSCTPKRQKDGSVKGWSPPPEYHKNSQISDEQAYILYKINEISDDQYVKVSFNYGQPYNIKYKIHRTPARF